MMSKSQEATTEKRCLIIVLVQLAITD